MILSLYLQMPLKKIVGPTSQKIVAEVMKKHKVVPDIVKVAPQNLLQVSFPSGVKADYGNTLAPTSVKHAPKIKFICNENEDDAYHLLYFSDPDTPCRDKPIYREFLLWCICNIPGNKVHEGEVIAEYISPFPLQGTGLHRFVFLLFKQQGYQEFDIPRLSNRRGNKRELFKIQKLCDKYNLGDPIAGNLFLAEWDEYVNVVYEKLSKL